MDQVKLYKDLRDIGKLGEDARFDLTRMISMIEEDSKLNFMSVFAAHLYPFINSPSSATQTIFLNRLSDFKGDLLRSSYIESTRNHGRHFHDLYEFEGQLDYVLQQVRIVSEALNRPALNSAQLAFALTLFNLTEVPSHIDSKVRPVKNTLFDAVKFEYNEGNHFWLDHGVELSRLLELSDDLLSYDGDLNINSEQVSSRICLSIKYGDKGLVVQPLEYWGLHNLSSTAPREYSENQIWLPNNTLIQPDQLGEFEELLNSDLASEHDWQMFLHNYPVFLYMIGDYESHHREVTLVPQILLEHELHNDLRPDFLIKRIGLDFHDILEIKKPQATMVSGKENRRKLSACVNEAISQVKTYSRFFDDKTNAKWAKSRYGFEVYRPQLHVLIGRDSAFRNVYEKQVLASASEASILTYDDLHRMAKHRAITVG